MCRRRGRPIIARRKRCCWIRRFRASRGLSEFIRREITADAIVGLAFSLSTMSRERLGEKAPAFEADMRKALAELSPDGRFTEIAELGALVARRG